jgi:hypothetical protein
MRKTAIWFALALALLHGCAREKYDKTSQGPVVTSARGDLAIDLIEPPAHKKLTNVLVVPVRVQSWRPGTVVVHPDRCRVEQFDGVRFAPNTRGKTYRLAPNKRLDLKLVFGDDHGDLRGSSFRIYLWVEDERGSLIEDLPPIVLAGAESFSEPARPLTRRKGDAAERDFPPPEKFTGPNPARGRDTPHVCPFCGEPRQGAGTCDACGND